MIEGLREQLGLLPDALAGHLVVTAIPLLVGVSLSVPLGLVAVRRPRLRTIALGLAGVIQTVPGLALLALMVPVLSALGDLLAPLGVHVPALGVLPVGIALTLYAVLPVLRNTITGVQGMDPALVEAGLALGMTPGQVLRHVELPLAAPVVLAGVRTAAVWVVGMGTLATPVGATSLGNYIFAGLQTRNPLAVLVGCLGAAGLALVVDGALAVVEHAVARRRPRLAAGALATLGALVLLGTAGRWRPATGEPRVVVGGKPFTEQYVLTRLLERHLHDAGFAVDRRDELGSTVLLDGLIAGQIDAGVDYSGTLWAHHLGREGSSDGERVRSEVCAWLAEHDGVRCVGPLGFENAYALAARREVAEAHGWRTLADLRSASDLRIGADVEFFQRPEWLAVRDGYGLADAAQVTFDSTFLYDAVARGDVDVITAYTSDGRVAAYDLVTLEDPLGALPPYDALLLVSDRAPAGVEEALRPLVDAIDVDAMRAANRAVDVDGRTPADAARQLP
ncbi:MAG: ABC transporter permease/substrate-binding protein [Alphaproteobacteria bacterium]|nr:ABC transporter permease/substrate-binding protein [Alphaproteobacteria bacterium]